mmetsp:Transcript_8058/g.6013  ORF Transcript_8058/g.6013 Transcript_8058/m.6013 type:complete len:173 (+) Transcript_8058:435-953(+)
MNFYFEKVDCKLGKAKTQFLKAKFHLDSRRKTEVVLGKAGSHLHQALRLFQECSYQQGISLCEWLKPALESRDSKIVAHSPRPSLDNLFPDQPHCGLLVNFVTKVDHPRSRSSRPAESDLSKQMQVQRNFQSEVISPSKFIGQPKEKNSVGSIVGKKKENSVLHTHAQVYHW